MPLVVVVLGVLTTVGVFWKAREDALQRFRVQLAGDATIRASIIAEAFEQRLGDLEALRRFYMGSTEVDRREFRAFVGPAPGVRAGIEAMAWAPRVPRSQRARIEAQARQEGLADFQIREIGRDGKPGPAGDRDWHYPILMIEPEERNQAMLGLDQGANPACLEAMARATDTGAAVSTGGIELAGRGQTGVGVMVFLPFYGKDLPTSTIPERRMALEGFVVGLFRVGEVVRVALSNTPPIGLPTDILDAAAPAGTNLLYHWEPRLQRGRAAPPPDRAPGAERLPYAFAFAGRDWRIDVSPGPAYRQARRALAHWLVLPVGLLLTTMLGFYLQALVAHRQRAEQRYMDLINNLAVGVYRNTPGEKGRFLEANPAIVAMFEADSKEQFMRQRVSDLYVQPVQRKEFVDKIARHGFVRDEEIELKTLKGRRFWASVSAAMRHDERGRVFFDGVIEDITVRKRAEESLQRERILLRTLIDHLPDAVYVKDTAGRKTLANRADLQNMRRASEAEVLGKTDFELFPPEEAARFHADDLAVIQSGQPILHREEYFCDALGEQRWLLTSKLPLRDERGGIVGLVGIGREITLRKRAEEAAQRERILLRTLIDHLPDAVYVKDTAGRKTVANRADYRNMGRNSEAEVLGKADDELFGREAAARFMADDQQVIRTGEPVLDREEDFLDSQGRQRWLLTSKLPLRDERGQIIGLVGIGRDITERKRAEEKLRLLSRAVEQSPASIIITDPQGRIDYVNPKFTEVTGYSLEEALGRNPRILKSGLTPPEEFARLWQTITAGRFWQGEFCNRRKDGTIFWEAASISPVTNGSGQVTHFVAVKEDITEMKQKEEELRVAKEAAEAASRAKSEFLANMSHEIRTPMNGVIGMTGLLLDTELSPIQREFAESIRNSGETLLTLLNDVLDFSKIEAGRMELETLDFDLRETVEDTAEILALRAQQKGLEFVCLIEPEVPSWLRGDPGRLRQVLTNLAGNAIKFTPRGEVSIRVSLAEDAPAEAALRFEVVDSGIGIPADKQDRLFSPFTQMDASTTRRYGGTGLGLSISKRLVELMRGTIGVESAENHGSRFWFTARFAKAPPATTEPARVAASIAGHRVLVVDDNATNRRLITLLLRSWDCAFAEAESGAAALAMLRAALKAGQPYDLALLDMHMPDMDGAELGERIKADPELAALPLLMLTSLADRGEAARLKQIGFAACLTKPLRQSQLQRAIAEVFGAAQGAAVAQSRFVFGGVVADAHRRRFRILLAEDNITNQRVALAILDRLGYRADAVANGVEVLKSLEALPYDLVLMDCQMPEMDGYETTRTLRDPASKVRSHDIPVIAMTAYAMRGDREKCIEAGMNDYVTKPIQPRELAEALERWLGKTEAHPEAEAEALAQDPDQARRIFDEAGLIDRLMGDRDLARSIAASFIDEASRQIAGLLESVERQDFATARRHAHSLKGSSANLGAELLRETASAIEAHYRDNENAQAAALLPELSHRFEILTAILRHFAGQDGARPS